MSELFDTARSSAAYHIGNIYQSQGIKDCGFASQEQCDKEYNGNWYYYFK